jgi:hypothetical protein
LKKESPIIMVGLGIVLSLAYAQGNIAIPEPVQKIFKTSCSVTGCHQGKYPAMNLSFEPDKIIGSTINMPSKEKPDFKIINTAEPPKSYILMKIRGDRDIAGSRMPLNAKPLKDADILSIQEWITSLKGAPAAASIAQGSTETEQKKKFENPAFWGTQVINLPTARMIERGRFLFRISHRYYQPVSSGHDSFFGLDGSTTTLLGFGFGISDRLGLSLARTNQFQEVELGLHWLILEQDLHPSLPFSAALHVGTSLITQSRPDKGLFDSDNFKLNVQLSLSHQLSNKLSLLVVPAYSTNTNHLNLESKGTLALGLGGRFMFLEDLSLIGEWVPVLSGYKDNSSGWGLGIEKKIGGHVFQFFILNVFGLTSDQFVSGGDLLFKDGDFRIGFNIFRSF